MTQTQVKTIDINAKEWFDKVNGNSYFSAVISINYGMDESEILFLPFQYGYGNHYVDMSAEELDKLGYVGLEKYENGSREPLWRYCQDKGIILRTSKKENCLKKEVKAIR